MVLCEHCKFLLKNKINTLYICWACDEEMSRQKVEDDVPCGIYEPLDSDLS